MGQYDDFAGEVVSRWLSFVALIYRKCNVRSVGDWRFPSVSISPEAVHEMLKLDNSQYLPLRDCHLSVCGVLLLGYVKINCSKTSLTRITIRVQ